MKEIQSTKGFVILVDDCDYDLSAFNWSTTFARGSKPVPFRSQRDSNGVNRTYLMHRIIAARMSLKGNIDHRDRDPLNNQRSNLRVASPAQNSYNRGLYGTNKSGYKGVSRNWQKSGKIWVSKIYRQGGQMVLGTFADPREAALAYDAAAIEHHGEFACTNKMLGLL